VHMGCGSSKDTNIDAVSVEVGTPGENPKPESASKDKAGWRGRLKSSRRRWKRKSIEKQRTPLQIGGGDADGDAAPLPVSSRLVHESKLQELHDKYDLDNMWELGKGACGSVHAIKLRSTGDTFAMKTVTLAMANLDSFDELKQELEMQKRLDHPNIAKVLESFEDTAKGTMYIVMELCSGGNLIGRLKKSRHKGDEHFVATLVEKMLGALNYCHSHGVAHRDIKLENIMYENDKDHAEPKLIDFGFSTSTKGGMWYRLGTPSYMAPELCVLGREIKYDTKVDVWALGVTAYLLLAGKRPFDHQDAKEKKRRIREEPLRFPAQFDNVSSDAKDFLRLLMTKDSAERPTAGAALKHAWIRSKSRMHIGTDAAQEIANHNEIVSALEAYSHADNLAKLALQVIAFSTPPDKFEELRALFQKMDEDGSGTISLAEFKKAMAQHPEIPTEHVEEMFFEMDVDANDEVDYTEFLAATLSRNKQMLQGASLVGAFHALDTDHDGFIDATDLERAFEGALSSAAAIGILEHLEASGRVNFDTFQKTMLAVVEGEQSGEATKFLSEVVARASKGRSEGGASPVREKDEGNGAEAKAE